MIAAGGAAALWERTTNPPGSQGVGLMLAQAAGARLADLELLQFHPTAVIGIPGREGFLVTEAIRGEGATLLDPDGERFVDELAPRDEVSRAIWERLQQTGAASVGLDMRKVDPAHFPNVFGALREAGLDPAKELVPVAPAAHYMMGGIVADLEARSSVPGLYAVGEASCTGLHGANRLASNSLSECFVFASRAVDAALAGAGAAPASPQPGEGERLRINCCRSAAAKQLPPLYLRQSGHEENLPYPPRLTRKIKGTYFRRYNRIDVGVLMSLAMPSRSQESALEFPSTSARPTKS